MKYSIKIAAAIILMLLMRVTHAMPLTGYWQNFTNPAQTPVKLTDIPAAYTKVIIAFADMHADGTVSFTLQGPPYDGMGQQQFIADIKAIRARGVKVLVSLGGQNGLDSLDSVTKENAFISSLSQVIHTYGFDGVDYDFESGLSTANVKYLLDATIQLKQQFNNQLLVTLAPETIDVYWQSFPNGKYDALIQDPSAVDAVQVQDYNSGCMPGINPGGACYTTGTEDFIVSQADSTIQTWARNGISHADSHYVIGLPATSQAAGSGYIDPSILSKALNCLKTGKQCDTYVPTKTYTDLGGVMTWSINWDAKNQYAFAKAY